MTLNKIITTKISKLTDSARKYDKDWTEFKRTCNTAFSYHGDNSFTAAANENDPDAELICHTTSTSICSRWAKDQEVVSVSSLQLDCMK